PRCDVDDRAAPLLDHRRQRSATCMEGGRQVRADDVLPFGRVDLEERSDLRSSGVVDEAVQSPEAIDDARDEAFYREPVADVGLKALSFGAHASGSLNCGFSTLFRQLV